MTATWGSNIKLTIFGESHGEAIGIVIDNIEAGQSIDLDYIYSEMMRRKPGKDGMSTQRNEDDKPRIISGVFNGVTTGAPICVVIDNNDKRSRDYSLTKDIARPGHADYTARVKYKGFNDYRGGGHFSGRLTAPIVFVGALAKSILKKRGIRIYSHIKCLNNVEEMSFSEFVKKNMGTSDITKDKLISSYNELLSHLTSMDIPVLEESNIGKIKDKIEDVKQRGDSIGGSIECCIVGIDSGYGSPFFNSIESSISSLMFSVPGVKGIEFGKGFGFTKILGSEANDEFKIDSDGNVLTNTNNNGGINGGISNSMPIEFTVALKPTSSIFIPQKSINMETMENISLNLKGRHDPTIVLRAIPVIESMAAISILDFISGR